MLILSRKLNEQVKIGDDITIKVIRIGRDVVKIGIDAPDNVAVHRLEISRRIEEQMQNDNGEPEE